MTVTAGLEPFHGLEINALARKLESQGRSRPGMPANDAPPELKF